MNWSCSLCHRSAPEVFRKVGRRCNECVADYKKMANSRYYYDVTQFRRAEKRRLTNRGLNHECSKY